MFLDPGNVDTATINYLYLQRYGKQYGIPVMATLIRPITCKLYIGQVIE